MLLNSCGICRMCVKETRVMLSLFDEDNLWKKIKSIADVDIREGDDLPQQICMECAKDAVNADATKWRCERADRMLRKAIIENDENDNVDIVAATGCDNLTTNCLRDDDDGNTFKSGCSAIMNYPEDSQEDHDDDDDDDDDSQCETVGLVIEVDTNTALSQNDNHRNDEVQTFSSSQQNKFEENALDTGGGGGGGDIKHDDGIHFKSVSPPFVDKLNSTELPSGAPLNEFNSQINDRTSFICQHCNINFISKYFLATHKCIAGHCKTTDPPICLNCNQVFPSNRHLASHKRFKHCLNKDMKSGVNFKMESTEPPTCSNCKKVFQSNQKLASHKRFQHCFREMNQNISDQFESNSKQEFPSCTNCKKVFKSKRHLAAHKRFKHCLNKEIDPNSKPIDTSDQLTDPTWKGNGVQRKRLFKKRKFVDEETYRKAVDLTVKGTPIRMWPKLIDVCTSTAFYLRRRIRSGEQFHFKKSKGSSNCKILRAVDVTLKQDEDMESSIKKTELSQDENYLPTSENTRSSFSAGV